MGKKYISEGKKWIQYWTTPEAGERLFLLIWIVFLTRETLMTTMFSMSGTFYNAVTLITVGGIAVKVFCYDSYRMSELAMVMALGGVAVMVAVRSGYQEPLFWAILVVGAKGVSFRKIIKTYVVVSGTIVGIAFVASLLDVIVNLQYEVVKEGVGEYVRNSFGIIYPTDFAAHIFFLMVIFFYLMGGRAKLWHYIFCVGIAAAVYLLCRTRLDTGCMMIAIILYGAVHYRGKHCQRIKKIYHPDGWIKRYGVWSMPVAAFSITLATILYNPGSTFWINLDKIMTNRLNLGQSGLNNYGIKLFGQPVPMIGNGGSTVLPGTYFFIDSSYLFVLLRYGLLFLVLVLATYFLCCKKYRDDRHFLIMIALVSLNCMIAHHLIELAYCPFALALFARRDNISESRNSEQKYIG
ncbi:MAG: hypothetical protein HFI63_11585 [Lachnospiraceae bacterium]|nr:hypothetical protein [Lachnospiraceae bacterium]